MTAAEPPPWSSSITTNTITAPHCTTHTSSDSPLSPFFNAHASTCPASEILPEIDAQLASIRKQLRQFTQQEDDPLPLDPPQPAVQPTPCSITEDFMTEFKADLARHTTSILDIFDNFARAPIKRCRRHCASTRLCSQPPMLQSNSRQVIDSLTPMPTTQPHHVPCKVPCSSFDSLPHPKLQKREKHPKMHFEHSLCQNDIQLH